MSDVICPCICHKLGAKGCTAQMCTSIRLLTETIYHKEDTDE